MQYKCHRVREHVKLSRLEFIVETSVEGDAMNLILVQLAVLVFLLAFLLERDDDKTHEDVDHEEGDDDDVDEVENGDNWTMV